MNYTIPELLEQLDRLAGYVAHHGVGVSLATSQLREAIKQQGRRTGNRHAATLEAVDRLASLISRTRMSVVGNVRSDGSITLSGDTPAAGLLEWFYLMSGPKKVKAHLSEHYATYTHVSVEGAVDGVQVDVHAVFVTDETRKIVGESAESSVHLLRRLQIAGAR